MTTAVVVLGIAVVLVHLVAWAVSLRLRYWQRRVDEALAEEREAAAAIEVERAQASARRIVLEAELVVAEEYLRIQRGRR